MKANATEVIDLEWSDSYGEMTWESAVGVVCRMNGISPLSDEQLSWYSELDSEIKYGTGKRPWKLPTTKQLKDAFDKKVAGFQEREYWSSHGAWPYPGKLAVNMMYGMESLKQVGFWGDTCRVRLVR
jgi:hypothetical protein